MTNHDTMQANVEAAKDFYGPYLDVTARYDYLDKKRVATAANACDSLNAGDTERARRFAEKYRAHDEAIDRLWERHDAIKNTPTAWVGHDAYLTYKYREDNARLEAAAHRPANGIAGMAWTD